MEIAARVIGQIADRAAASEQRASSKKTLIAGPKELWRDEAGLSERMGSRSSVCAPGTLVG
jgi:hypothetical protein